MITREFTDQYLDQLDSLSKELYSCWRNSFCHKTNQLDKTKLKQQIRSYGICFEDNEKTKPSIKAINKFHFRTHRKFKKFRSSENQKNNCESIELPKLVIAEIEKNLFTLPNMVDKEAYANVIIRDLKKRYIYNHNTDDKERDIRYKEMFEHVLNRKFIFKNEVSVSCNDDCEKYPNYELTFKLATYFNFIDSLNESFICFKINLEALYKNTKFKLYTPSKNNTIIELNQPVEYLTNNNQDIVNVGYFEEQIVPKFKTELSDECLIKIMHYLLRKKKLINPNADCWLFWFNLKDIKVAEPLKWNGSPTLLSNVIQHLCGSCISNTIKTAFGTDVFVKPTWKIYQSSKMYKEIERIITVSKQKNS